MPKAPASQNLLPLKVIALRDGHFSMASLSPLRPFHRLLRFTSPLTIVSPPSAPLSIRSNLNNFTDRSLPQVGYYLGTPYRQGESFKSE